MIKLFQEQIFNYSNYVIFEFYYQVVAIVQLLQQDLQTLFRNLFMRKSGLPNNGENIAYRLFFRILSYQIKIWKKKGNRERNENENNN